MSEQLLKLWMPISKTKDGEYTAILTDTSLDRDNESMAESVMDDLAKQLALPALADHENKMSSWVGGFKNLEKIHNGANYAVQGTPTFFSKEANPKAQQIKKQIDEATEMGMPCGVSIGAKPIEHKMVEKDGKTHKQHTKIEVMEGTFTPIPANRGSYAYVAKSFGIQKPGDHDPKMKSCVAKLMSQGKSEKSAYAICNEKVGNKSIADLIYKEVDNMSDEEKTDSPKEEAKEEAPKEEAKPDESSEPSGEKPKEEPEKKVKEIDVQKIVKTEVDKALAKIPKLKAIQETIPEETGNIETQTMGFLESQLAKQHNFEVEK